MTRRDPRVLMRHMLDHSREAFEMVHGRSRADLDTDRQLNLALVRLLEIVGEAADGPQALALFQELRPDLVTLDLVLPGMVGLRVLRRIVEMVPGLPVVVLSALDGEKFISQALEAGAVDYLCKPLERDPVLLAVDKALVGGAG